MTQTDNVESPHWSNVRTFIVSGEKAMGETGRQLARDLIDGGSLAGSVILLSGELGAGKTTICRGFLRECGVTDRIKSPTYTLLEQYDTALATLCHLDLYRLTDSEDLEYLAFRELLEARACLLVEWPERVSELQSLATLWLELSHIDGSSREVKIISTKTSYD